MKKRLFILSAFLAATLLAAPFYSTASPGKTTSSPVTKSCGPIQNFRFDAMRYDPGTATYDLDFSWSTVFPSPACLYDWEMWNCTETVLYASGNTWSPGTVQLFSYNNLNMRDGFSFKVRANCCNGDISPWVSVQMF